MVDDRGRLELTTERRAVPFNAGGKSETVQGRLDVQATLVDGVLSGTAALEVEDAKPVASVVGEEEVQAFYVISMMFTPCCHPTPPGDRHHRDEQAAPRGRPPGRDRADAERFVEHVGFAACLTDSRRPGPSLYVAVCGRRDARACRATSRKIPKRRTRGC